MANPQAPQAPSAPAQASPESLDQVIETTKSRGWWALWAIAVAIILALVWSFVADIPQQNTATGVVSALSYSTSVAAPADGTLTLNNVLNNAITPGTILGAVAPFDGSASINITTQAQGKISSVFASNGQGVTAGQEIATITTPPNPAKGIVVATYVPASQALTYFAGQSVEVTVTDVSTSKTIIVHGTVDAVSDSPTPFSAMVNMSGSQAQAQAWSNAANGMPFRIMITLTDFPTNSQKLVPGAGQLVSIVHTYGTVHPIQLLFGGK